MPEASDFRKGSGLEIVAEKAEFNKTFGNPTVFPLGSAISATNFVLRLMGFFFFSAFQVKHSAS